jgi:hypothetical protein
MNLPTRADLGKKWPTKLAPLVAHASLGQIIAHARGKKDPKLNGITELHRCKYEPVKSGTNSMVVSQDTWLGQPSSVNSVTLYKTTENRFGEFVAETVAYPHMAMANASMDVTMSRIQATMLMWA